MRVYRYKKMDTLETYYRTDKKWKLAVATIPEDIRQGSREWERKEINLYFTVYDFLDNGKIVCSIHCPINPIPVCGKFTAPSFYAVDSFLRREGWEQQGAAVRLPKEEAEVELSFEV